MMMMMKMQPMIPMMMADQEFPLQRQRLPLAHLDPNSESYMKIEQIKMGFFSLFLTFQPFKHKNRSTRTFFLSLSP